jgi:5-(carboxyamino)imidazole ribonucleotide synthase
VLDFPLGSTKANGFAVMLNLIGETPPTAEILAIPGAHLHLYGKSPRPGRKLGHITLCANTFEELSTRLGGLPAAFHDPVFCLDSQQSRSA